jgi:hypothetical protein
MPFSVGISLDLNAHDPEQSLGLFTRAVVAIDGSKLKAVNNRDKNFTVAKVAKRMEQVDASIARYLAALDRADREDSDVAEARTGRMQDKIAGLRRQMQALKAMEQQVQDAPDKQVSLTDPDARSTAASGRGTGRPEADQGPRPIRSKGRHRYLSPPDRLLHLPAKAEMHPGQAQAA